MTQPRIQKKSSVKLFFVYLSALDSCKMNLGASTAGFFLTKSALKACPFFCTFLDGLDIVDFSQEIVAIEVPVLFTISSFTLIAKRITLIIFELQLLGC